MFELKDMADKTATVYIYIDENDAAEYGGIALDEYLSADFGDKIFLISEDGKSLFLTEDGASYLIQEYFE